MKLSKEAVVGSKLTVALANTEKATRKIDAFLRVDE
jgi:hypothetical protein